MSKKSLSQKQSNVSKARALALDSTLFILHSMVDSQNRNFGMKNLFEYENHMTGLRLITIIRDGIIFGKFRPAHQTH